MLSSGNNGGPPLDIDAKMRWVRINLSDILEGMEGLTWEQRGFYCTALFKMYARMEGLPFDERQGSTALHCDVRTYRRFRDLLVKEGKFYIDDGQIKNKRVEREIADFCREVKRRRDAAIQRDEKKRKAVVDSEDLADFGETSAGLRADFGAKSEECPEDVPENAGGKPNKNNVCTATAVVEKDHSSGGNQKPETRNQIKNNHQQLSKTLAADASPRVNFDLLYDQLTEAANGALYPLSVSLQVLSEPIGWIEAGADLERDILPVVRALGKRSKPQKIQSWGYFASAVSEAKDRRLKGLPPAPEIAPKKPFKPSRYATR